MNSLDPFFRPRSIALIGAAHTEIKLGGVMLRNLLKFRGDIFPVNPKYDDLMGVRSYRSVPDLPRPVDLAIILRPSDEVPQIMRDLQGKTKCVIIASSGFSEIGRQDLQDEVRDIGKAAGVRMLGPNCMGLVNTSARLDTFFIPPSRLKRPARGRVAVVSQSGAILHCLFEHMGGWRAGVSKAVGYGNAVDVDESDLYEYLLDDAATDVVVSYIESVGDGRKFIDRARKLDEKKPLLILKAGKGSVGQTAAFSHTGRLAGRYEVFRSVLSQFGLNEAADFEELVDAVKALAYQCRRSGSRVCIVTNGGGSGVLAADECMRNGLEVTPLPAEKAQKLRDIFPSFYGIHNPLDLTAQVTDEEYRRALDLLGDDYDGFIVIALAGVMGISEELAGRIVDFKKRCGKPVVGLTTLNPLGVYLRKALEREGIPVYPSPERAVRGLKALLGGTDHPGGSRGN